MFYIECMRIACVSIPHFYVQVERLRRPEIEGRPVIIGGRPDERAPVIDCSEEAAERGVRASLSLKEAYHLCPDALFVEFDEERNRIIWEGVVSMLQSFSMRIETSEAGVAYLDITKVLSIYGDEGTLAARVVDEIEGLSGLRAKAGIGNSLFVSWIAASMAHPHTRVVPMGKEMQFVSSLPTGSLPVDQDIKERLGLLGLHRLGRIAPLPMEALVAQFGRAGKLIWEVSNGKGEERPFPRIEGRYCPEREVVSEMPIGVVEHLRAPLEGAVREIARELTEMKRLCRAIRLVLHLRNGRSLERQWIMHAPTSFGEEILRRIMDGLAAVAVESPITGFRVSALALSRREYAPDTLFRTSIHHGERLKGVKDYLKAKYGSLPLVKVEEREPGARLPERRFVFVEI